MSKLRWTLLILGGVFILALALWELWRPRQARGQGAQRRAATQDPWTGGPPALDGRSDEPTARRRAAAPDARVHETRSREALGGAVKRDPSREEIVIAVTEEDASLRDEQGGESSGDELGTVFPGAIGVDPAEPWIGEPGLAEAVSPASELHEDLDSSRVVLARNPDEFPTAELPVLAEAAVDVPPPQALEQTTALEGLAPAAPIVRWPPEALRRVVAVRLVAPPERFPGRAVRLALGAEGFLLGKFNIFHKPDKGHRAIVSAASLTRPGTFDLDSMDSLRYLGLSLFVVLPGPRPEQQAIDELVDVAQNLCERLQGELQDAQGVALTDESIQMLRAALPASAGGEASS